MVLSLCWASPLKADERDEPEEEGYQLRISLPTEDDYVQWLEPGFRLALGYGYGLFTHLEHDEDLWAHAMSFRPHLRLNEQWGVGVTLNYGISKGDLIQGLRWSTTFEVTGYFYEQLGLTLGAGLGGLWVTCSDESYYACSVYLETASTTESRYLTSRERIADCEGDGLVGVARLDYFFVTGSNFASGPYVDATAQRVRCTERTGKTNIQTGRDIELWEHWSHIGMNAGWWFTWR